MSDAVIKARYAKVQPYPRSAGRRIRAALAGRAFAAAGLTVFAVWGFANAIRSAPMAGTVSTEAVTPPTPRQAWIEVPRPIRIWSLQAPDLTGLPLVYTARRQTIGSGREDILKFGALGVDEPSLRVRVFRRDGADRGTPAPLYAALARQAADAGLAVERSGLPDLLPTRFGKFDVSPLVLSGGGTSAARLTCSGFRLALDQPTLTISGLACGKVGVAMPRQTLGCLLDRLDLASGGEDRALIDFVAATELRRNPDCAGMRLGPDEVHAAWLDDKPATRGKSLHRR